MRYIQPYLGLMCWGGCKSPSAMVEGDGRAFRAHVCRLSSCFHRKGWGGPRTGRTADSMALLPSLCTWRRGLFLVEWMRKGNTHTHRRRKSADEFNCCGKQEEVTAVVEGEACFCLRGDGVVCVREPAAANFSVRTRVVFRRETRRYEHSRLIDRSFSMSTAQL